MKAETNPSLPRRTGTILSEDAAPRTGSAAAPIVIFLLLAVILYGGTLFMDHYAGGFNPLVIGPNTEAPKAAGADAAAKGRALFSANCSPCHQANGLGLAGQFPPLAGSEWVLTPGPNRVIRIVLNGAMGPMQVKGAEFNNVMIPWKDTLKDDDIAAVLTFVRSEWGNKAPAVTVDQVKKIRADTGAKSDAWTAEELQKVPENE